MDLGEWLSLSMVIFYLQKTQSRIEYIKQPGGKEDEDERQNQLLSQNQEKIIQ